MITIDVKNEEEIYKLTKEVENKQEEQLNKEYTINDFALIRTSNFLPEDHIIKPICDIPFVTNINNVAHSAIFKILKERDNINVYDENEYEKFKELVNKYSPLSSQYRSTIHFTINGLVTSHGQGYFDDQDFIIIDKLNKHLGIDNIRCIRMEDTFISGNFNISNESIILINKEKYEKLKQKNYWLNKYNVVLYEGNEKLAVEKVLLEMGITPEKIEAHSSKYSERTNSYESYLDDISKKYNIEREPHFYSKEYQEDDEKNILLWQIYDRYFYNLLFEYFNVDADNSKNMIMYLTSNENRTKQEEAFEKFILSVGIDKYCDFVLKYNKNIVNLINQGLFPTNNEILDMNDIIIGKRNKVL